MSSMSASSSIGQSRSQSSVSSYHLKVKGACSCSLTAACALLESSETVSSFPARVDLLGIIVETLHSINSISVASYALLRGKRGSIWFRHQFSKTFLITFDLLVLDNLCKRWPKARLEFTIQRFRGSWTY